MSDSQDQNTISDDDKLPVSNTRGLAMGFMALFIAAVAVYFLWFKDSGYSFPSFGSSDAQTAPAQHDILAGHTEGTSPTRTPSHINVTDVRTSCAMQGFSMKPTQAQDGSWHVDVPRDCVHINAIISTP